MNAWTDENGKEKMIVGSREASDAQSEVNRRIASIKQSLKMIATELEKWEALNCPDWSHAGSLGHLDAELISLFEWVTESD